MRWRFTLYKINIVLGIPVPFVMVISEPIGWAEISFKLQRHKEWHGIFFEYSLPLKFYDNPKDATQYAYTYLRSQYEADGVSGFVTLIVEQACDDTDAYTIEGQWRMDFGSYKETRGESCLVELSLEPENRLMTFINRYDQKVDVESTTSFGGTTLVPYTELPLNALNLPPKAVPVTSDVSKIGTAEDIDFTEHDDIVAGAGTSFHSVISYFQVTYNNIELDEIANYIDNSSQGLSSAVSINPTWKVVIPGTYTLTFVSFTFTVKTSIVTDTNNTSCGIPNRFNDMSVQLWVDIAGVATMVASGSLAAGGCYSSVDSITINPVGYSIEQDLVLNDEVKVYIRVESSGTFDKALLGARNVDWTINYNQVSRNLKLTAFEYAADTPADVFLINETGSRILESITDDGFRMLSDYYGRTDSQPYAAPSGIDGCGSLRCLTSGLHIRSYGSAKLNMSFKQFFEENNSIDNIGLGLEDDATRAGYELVRVEPMEFFYDSSIILTLDKIPLVAIEVIKEEHISIFKGGYSKWEAEEYTGLDEFATGREYRTNLSSISNTLDQVCNFIASGYAIEITRRIKLYDPFTQQDWRFDNDTFIICLKRNLSTTFEVEQGNITGDSNLIDAASVYNFRISPARNALRWLRTVLNSYRDVEDGDSQLIFTDGDGNVLATGLMTGDCIIENAALAENQTLDAFDCGDPWDAHPVYLPETWSFDYPLSYSDYLLLKAAPKGIVQARFGQEATFIDLYLRSVEYKPNEGMARWEMLPKRTYPIDDCLIYIIQTRGTGLNLFGSSLLIDAQLSNLFVFVDGELMKYNDLTAANNEIVSFDPATGYGTLSFTIDPGKQVTVIHIPSGDGHCDACIHRYEGRGSGSTAPIIAGFGLVTMANMFVFYNGSLMKYNDVNVLNNEVLSYVGGTEILTFAASTNTKRELRVIGFAACECIKVFSGHGDGTTSPSVTGLGEGTLANILTFYNGNLLKYNDADPLNNDITGYSDATDEIFLNIPTNANRELRALKLVNC